MLSASTAVSTYLNSTDAGKIYPFVSGEWNYNLVYPPFATFSGLGNGFDTSPYLITSNWTPSSKIAVTTTTGGYISDVFTNSAAIQLSLTPTTVNGAPDLSDYTNFSGSAKITFALPASVNKCYKFVFYVKSMTDDIINLVAQADSPNAAFSGTSFKTIDNINWQKIEVKSGMRATDGTYSSIGLTLDMTNTTLSAGTAWGLIVSQVKVYEITHFDYANGNLWSTDNPFTYFRPGESYVTCGNNAISEVVRTADLSKVKGSWKSSLPVSSAVYSPRVLFRPSTSNPLYKNGILSSFSQYKYFVSEKPVLTNSVQASTSIGAMYEELLAVNKIVLKFNLGQSKPDNIVVNLYNDTVNSGTPVATVNVPATSITDAGTCVLYWNGTTFTTTKWSWNPTGNSNMPAIDETGNISMYLGGSKVNGYVNITKINVTQMSSTSVTNYNVDNAINSDTDLELRRFQIVEVSPRLELDMTPYTVTVDIKKEIDANNTPLPISSMSANSAILEFSNIPLSGPANAPRSVFSTNANTLAYITPLAGMLLKNTKFYTYFYLPDVSNTLIPSGIFYADTWDNQDIKSTKVNCFDIMKFLQTVPVSDYVSESQDLFTVFTNLMDFAGFSDYNYDQLKALFTDNEQFLVSSFFFADAASKTVYKILQEAFVAYQVGAWIDEYGVMNFKNLKAIITNNNYSYDISDNNIVNDSYSETINTKIGKILLRYRGPNIKRSVGLGNVSKTSSILQVSPDIIWKQDSEDVVPFTLLSNSINSYSQNFYETDPGSLQNLFFGNTINHAGYVMIENEIMSSGNVEISLSAQDATGKNIVSKPIFPSSQDELNTQIAYLSNQTGAAQIVQNPTGRFVNVERGLFGTKSSSHKVLSTSADYSAKFITLLMAANSGSTTSSGPMSIANNKIQVLTQGKSAKTMVSAISSDNGYSTYSAKFKIPVAPPDAYAGIFFGAGSGTTYFAEIHAQGLNNYYKSYILSFYSIGSAGLVTQLIKPIDISNYLHGDFDNEPQDALYDAELAYILNLKFVNVPGQRVLSINSHKYFLDGKTNSLGQQVRPAYWINSTLASSVPAGFSGQGFGFFASTNGTITSSFELAEVYGTESPIFETVDYYYQTRQFLNSIVQGINTTENSFLVQVRPEVRGINYYDVQLALTPSLGSEFFKSYYSFYYYPNQDTGANPQFMSVKEDALSYSNINSTGYRAKFAIANNSRHAVFTSTGTTSTKIATANLLIASRGMVTLTPQLTIEKVINPQNINEIIEIQTDWIQSRKSADSIIKTIAGASDAFSKDISIEIFGNPLIQVGDILRVTYTLKNIQSILFFVKSVEQNFDTGLKTTVVLNQITYNGVNRNNLGIVFPYPANASGGPNITNISPNTGAAGDTVTITGTGIGSDATVLFGKNIATRQSITPSTSTASGSITVTVPTAPNIGPVDISIVSAGLSSTLFGGFTYTFAAANIEPITALSATVTSIDSSTSTYNGTTTWSVGTTVGLLYNSYSWQLSGIGTAVDQQGVGSNVPDLPTGTHSLGLTGLIPGDTYTLTITPLYTASGIATPGVSASTTFAIPSLLSNPTPSPTPSPTTPATPVISGGTFVNANTTLNTAQISFNIAQDTTSSPAIIGYNIYIISNGATPTTSAQFYSTAALALSAGSYTLTTSGTFSTTLSYTAYAVPVNSSNVVGTQSNSLTIGSSSTSASPIITLSASGAVQLNWSIPSGSTIKYTSYSLSMNDTNTHNAVDVITANPAGTSWTDGAGNVISTDGFNFTYTRWSNYILFTPSTIFSASLTGSGINSTGVSVQSNVASISYSIPALPGGVYPNVSGPLMALTTSGGYVGFSWNSPPLPSGSPSTRFDYELYNGTDATGTLLTSVSAVASNTYVTGYSMPPTIPLYARVRVTPVSAQYTSSWGIGYSVPSGPTPPPPPTIWYCTTNVQGVAGCSSSTSSTNISTSGTGYSTSCSTSGYPACATISPPPPPVVWYCTTNVQGVAGCSSSTSSTNISTSGTGYSTSCSTSGYPACATISPTPTPTPTPPPTCIIQQVPISHIVCPSSRANNLVCTDYLGAQVSSTFQSCV